MTTIILTIIGILLAAAAALMVIFYGGDAFNAGSVGARANTLQNAGTNVLSAIQLYRADGKLISDIKSTADLVGAAGTDNNYLKEIPSFASVNPTTAPVATTVGGLFHVTNVPAEVCTRVNKNLGSSTPSAVAESTTLKMGCDNTTNIFFANA